MGLDTGSAQHLYSAHIKAGLLNEYAQSVGEQLSPSDSQPLAIFTAHVAIKECICFYLRHQNLARKKDGSKDGSKIYIYVYFRCIV